MTEVISFSSQPLKVVFLPAGLPLCTAALSQLKHSKSIPDARAEFPFFAGHANLKVEQWRKAVRWSSDPSPLMLCRHGRAGGRAWIRPENPSGWLSEVKRDPKTSRPRMCPRAQPLGTWALLQWGQPGRQRGTDLQLPSFSQMGSLGAASEQS